MDRRFLALHRFRIVLASIFAGSTLLYNILWMAAVRWIPVNVELGFDAPYVGFQQSLAVSDVHRDSPAEKAGLRIGDRIIAIDGRRIEDAQFQLNEWSRHKPSDTVQLTIERPGRLAPLILTGVFRHLASTSRESGLTEYFAGEIRDSYPVPFVIVGLTVLFLRLDDPYAWLMAFLFAGFATGAGIPDQLSAMAPRFHPFAVVYRSVFVGMLGSLSYLFFALFPTRSLLDRRLPWLKWLSLALGAAVAVPALLAAGFRSSSAAALLLGTSAVGRIALYYEFAFMALGLISLATNAFLATDLQARRKIRVIFWGTIIGTAPLLTMTGTQDFAGISTPPILISLVVAVSFLFPLSFAYAVVKHRVLEIPALLRRSARYLLVQRGFTFFLSLLSIGLTLAFALSFTHYLQPGVPSAQPAGIGLGAVFGTVLLWGGLQVHKEVSGRIDRAFFRSAYDARKILEDLVEKTATATNPGQLAHLLEHHIKQALQPSSLIIYFPAGAGRLAAASSSVPPEERSISVDLPILTGLIQRGEPWEVPQAGDERVSAEFTFAPLRPDCLVPMLGRGGRLVGLLVLGSRLSDEPYSGEDKRLLASVARQAGTALENMRLAHEIAERIETERRTAREMEIAKEVQTRLLPQEPPHLRSLEFGAQCIQARSVGGDYYDFFDLGAGRVGFVLADVSGKGVHAALLMANLQAHLRSQCTMAPIDLVRVLQHVNRMLWKSTASQHYATLFLGVYEDDTRRLSYVNCGHIPPLCMRRDGSVERLAPTATVIGMFEDWEGSVARIQLAQGDVLAVFSDGITEAARDEEEFGEARVIDELRSHHELAAHELVASLLAGVQRFNTGAQSDDLTLLVAAVRA